MIFFIPNFRELGVFVFSLKSTLTNDDIGFKVFP